jgi:caspase domain-containing protein
MSTIRGRSAIWPLAALVSLAASTPAGAQPASYASRLYDGSYALIIGVSQYDARKWAPLPRIPAEADRLAGVLKAQGFAVTRVTGRADARAVKGAIEQFINDHGYQPKARLLIFFAGHGYTLRDGQMGYIVPSDAAHPSDDERGFLRSAIPMQQFDTWARQMDARHVMFIFDSCFSGTIFLTRSGAMPDARPLDRILAERARVFLTAGSADQPVPAQSVFTPLLIRGLQGEADVNRDGLITGTELGLWIQQQADLFASNQTPQFGKVRDPDLERGDIVFESDTKSAATLSPLSRNPTGSVPPATPSNRSAAPVVPARAPFVGSFVTSGWVEDDGSRYYWSLDITQSSIVATAWLPDNPAPKAQSTCEWLDRPEPMFVCASLPGRRRIAHADPKMEEQLNLMLFALSLTPDGKGIVVREPRDGAIRIKAFVRR